MELEIGKKQLDFSSKEALNKSLREFLEGVRNDLLSLSRLTSENKGAVDAAATDLATVHTATDAALAKMAKMEQIAAALEATRGHLDTDRDLDLRGFKSLKLGRKYDPNGFEFSNDADGRWIPDAFRSRPGQFALLMATNEDLQHLPDAEKQIIARWKTRHDTLAVCHELLLSQKRDELGAYMKRGGIKSLAGWSEYEGLSKQLSAAMSTGDADDGLEWVPTGVGQLLLPEVYPDFAFLRLIPSIAMPRSPYLYPVAPPHGYAKKAREATSDTPASNRNLPNLTLQTRNTTFTAVKLAGMLRHSSEIEEDTIVQLAAEIRFFLGMAIEASKESACVNGQASAISGTASSFDTGETFDDGSSTGLEDQRVCWNGERYYASLTGVAEDASTGLIADHTFNLRSKMGRMGKSRSDTVWVTGYKGEARLLAIKDGNGNPVVLTADKMGGAGTFSSGVIGRVAGSPLYISNEMPENLNAAGVADGLGGTYTSILLINTTRRRMGEVRMTRLEATREGGSAFEQDAIYIKATARGHYKAPVLPNSTTEKSVGAIVGVN